MVNLDRDVMAGHKKRPGRIAIPGHSVLKRALAKERFVSNRHGGLRFNYRMGATEMQGGILKSRVRDPSETDTGL